MCAGMGPMELLIILAIVTLLFGASRLPQLGKALGETVRNFKKGTDALNEIEPPAEKAPPIEAHEVGQLEEAEVVKDEEKA
jgi:sec-independent protein translocase protein TatA